MNLICVLFGCKYPEVIVTPASSMEDVKCLRNCGGHNLQEYDKTKKKWKQVKFDKDKDET